MMIGFKRMAAMLLAAGLLVSVGCVSKKVEPEHKPKLGISQSTDGILTMSLDTEVGYKYSILYLDPKEKRWKMMKGCESIMGTGKTIEIQKRVNPRKPVPALTVDYVKL
ncbi:hypothetical protein PDESU_04230 [Pontiella desulfatans]|uniref:Uncharacterized protein n=1 Tax=Pontiella desulfatans TaxID=2750659 RepID=A0A6C2U6U0_PONDE|nr:hypothetical protein [Pontiella desulfatans]VGO15645.1 hypothetical protein PDESU_04230 [Pontiella desulfatans]